MSLRRLVLRIAQALRPGRADEEAAREIAAHLALLEAEYARRGLSSDAARTAAHRAFGSAALAADAHRDARSLLWLDDGRRDVAYALRTIRREPGFALVVVVTLALGIGANTAIFSVVHSVLIKPLPYRDSARLVRVWENVPGSEIGDGKGPDRRYAAMDVADLLAVPPLARTIAGIAAFGRVRLTTTIDGDATRMDGFRVSADFFPLLGVAPLIGRTIAAADATPGRDRVLVLGYVAWQRFGADPRVVGRTVTFTGDPASPFAAGVALGTPYVVVGVMPNGFRFPYDTAQFWVPRVLAPPANGRPSRVETIARLADGAPPAAAAAELDAIRRDVRGSDSPGRGAGASRPRYELIALHDELTGPVRPALVVLTAAVALVLLIACVNVANLLLARTASRQREIAVRAAIGAAPSRLLRQLLAESLLLAAVGGASGTALAFGGVRLFRLLGTTLDRSDLGSASVFPRLAEVSVDSAALAFAAAVSLATGVVFGLAPALRHALPRPTATLREASVPSPGGGRHGLVLVEIALATVLLVAAGLLMNSFVRLATVDPGFEAAHLITFQLGQSASLRPEEQRSFAEEFVTRLAALPDVQSVAYARQLPLVQLQDIVRLTILRGGVEQTLTEAPDIRFVSRDYLKTMDIGLVRGRAFEEQDGAGRPAVVIVNEALARNVFAGENPIGQTMLFGPPDHRMPLEVIGVARNVRQFGLDRAAEPQYFMDIRQVPTDPAFRAPPLFPVGVYYTLRTAADAGAVLAAVRAVARQFDAHAALIDVATMEQIVANSITRPRMYAVLVVIFATVAFALAVIGLYGVMAYSVAQRTHEIGVRVALGAGRRDVMRLVLRRSGALTAAGIVLGICGAAGLTHYLDSLLFGLRPLDPATFGAVAAVFAAVAMLASYVPARRAASVDPLVALRQE
ncbi:MAG TPA: ABC transporter permease [Vicinamibacterales bacterium]|nr:ABC transporter permease [Vicinamibacterales bacterium]